MDSVVPVEGGRGGGWSASQGPPRHGRGRGRGHSWSGNRSYTPTESSQGRDLNSRDSFSEDAVSYDTQYK